MYKRQVLLGIGFLFTILGKGVQVNYLVPLWTLAGLYFFHTIGELCLSPIGLSVVTKLAPSHMTGTLMGAWFLSFAGSNYIAGSILAPLTGTEEGQEHVILSKAESLEKYVSVFEQFGWIAIICGACVIIISPLLKKLLHGIK